jgi:hypothetical protein
MSSSPSRIEQAWVLTSDVGVSAVNVRGDPTCLQPDSQERLEVPKFLQQLQIFGNDRWRPV